MDSEIGKVFYEFMAMVKRRFTKEEIQDDLAEIRAFKKRIENIEAAKSDLEFANFYEAFLLQLV